MESVIKSIQGPFNQSPTGFSACPNCEEKVKTAPWTLIGMKEEQELGQTGKWLHYEKLCCCLHRGIIKLVVVLLSPASIILTPSFSVGLNSDIVYWNKRSRNSPDYTTFNTLSELGSRLPNETLRRRHTPDPPQDFQLHKSKCTLRFLPGSLVL